jgi:methylenetetrahydrofolate dehydrogenase (NADP+)/methenyltetrahydrofolate cyclohydrolase
MKKLLSGSDLASYIKDRQEKAVRRLLQSDKIVPKLSIVQVIDDPVINTYIKLKKKYGSDIGVEVDAHNIPQSEAPALIKKLNADKSIHGIIVQLPLEDISETDNIVNLVHADKDVDALTKDSNFQPATPTAIMWLLAGNNIDLKAKKVLLIGKGKLVGEPLHKMLKNSGIDVEVADRSTISLKNIALEADIIITATGSPSILTSDMIKRGAVVVDAGVASESGKTVGDVADDVYNRDDITLTPKRGGVGPLTVCSLFENVIISATPQKQITY